MVSNDVRKKYDVLIAYGDLHMPYHDPGKLKILYDIIKTEQPDYILDGGDFINADCLSTFMKHYYQKVGLQQELDMFHEHSENLIKYAPNAKKILLRDNHFFRRLADMKKGNDWLHQLNATDAESLLKTTEYNWDVYDEYIWKDTIIFKHGDDAQGNGKCPANKIRNEAKESGLSMVRFHSHVSGIELHKRRDNVQVAMQLGSFEDVDQASYIKAKSIANWTTSIGLFYIAKRSTSFFTIPVLFNQQGAVVNSKFYEYKKIKKKEKYSLF